MSKRLTTDALFLTERLVGREKALWLIIDGIVSVVASNARAVFGHICGINSLHYDDDNLALLMENLTGESWKEDPKRARRAFVKAQGGNRIQEVSFHKNGFIPVGWAYEHEAYKAPEKQVDYTGTFGKAPEKQEAKKAEAS